jgi:hypothetical protein
LVSRCIVTARRLPAVNPEQADRIERKLDEILHHLKLLGVIIMADFTALNAAVTAETSAEGGLITAFKGLQAQVAALQPNQAAIDALATQIGSNIAAMVAAIPANTPVTPAQMKATK